MVEQRRELPHLIHSGLEEEALVKAIQENFDAMGGAQAALNANLKTLERDIASGAEPPDITGEDIEPGTFPQPPSDGAAPTTSPTPTLRGGPKFIAVSWVANLAGQADPVTYEIHVSATSGFVAGAATKVAETPGTLVFVRTLQDGTPLAYDTDYHVRLIAKDVDGAAPAGTQAGPVRIERVEAPDMQVGIGGGNRVSGSGFDQDGDGNGIADEWQEYEWPLDPGQTYTMVSTDNKFGGAHQRYQIPVAPPANAARAGLGSNEVYLFRANKTYVFSVWAKTNKAFDGLLGIGDFNPASTVWVENPTPDINKWQRWVRRVVIGGADASGRFYIAQWNNTGVAVDTHIDGAQLEEGDLPTAYAPKPDEILPGTVGTTQIADNAVTTPKLIAEAVVAGKIAAGAVETTKLAAEAVTAEKIAANTITANQIASRTITAEEILAGTITAEELAAIVLSVTKIYAPAQSGWRLEIGDPGFPIRYWDDTEVRFSFDTNGNILARAIRLSEAHIEDFLEFHEQVAEVPARNVTYDVYAEGFGSAAPSWGGTTPAESLAVALLGGDWDDLTLAPGWVWAATEDTPGYQIGSDDGGPSVGIAYATGSRSGSESFTARKTKRWEGNDAAWVGGTVGGTDLRVAPGASAYIPRTSQVETHPANSATVSINVLQAGTGCRLDVVRVSDGFQVAAVTFSTTGVKSVSFTPESGVAYQLRITGASSGPTDLIVDYLDFKAAARAQARLAAYAGVAPVAPLDHSEDATGNSTTPATGTSDAATLPDALFVGAIVAKHDTPQTFDSPTNGFTEVAENATGTGSTHTRLGMYQKVVSAGGQAATAVTLSGAVAREWAGVIAVFKAKPGEPPAAEADALRVFATTPGPILKVKDEGSRVGQVHVGTPAEALVAALQSTTSTSFTDLATAGPQVTVTIGQSGMALVIVTARIYMNTGGAECIMTFEVSGASTHAAGVKSDGLQSGSTAGFRASLPALVTGLNPGTTTFKAKYRTLGNTGNFEGRRILVVPL